jgi:hypothetical protein
MDKASYIVRDPAGKIVEIPDPVPVDQVHCLAEVQRLRAKYAGRRVNIDSSQIVEARARRESLTAA